MDFFLKQADYIFFFHSIALIILAAACFVIKMLEKDGLPWFYLGSFGLIRGIYEFLGVLKPLMAASLFIDAVNCLLIVSSCLFLFEFGRSGILRLQGKAPGRWIFFPLLAIVLLGGLLAGGDELIAVAQLAIGFPGGILAAIAFRKASRRLLTFSRLSLTAGGAMIALYAVITVLLALKSPYFDALFSNGEIFLRKLALSGDLLSGLLALSMAFAISCYFMLHIRLDTALYYFKERYKYVFWLSSLAMVLIIAAGWAGTQFFGNHARSDLGKIDKNHAETLEKQIKSQFDIVDQDVMTMAESPEIVRALLSGRKKDIDAGNAVLDYHKWTLKTAELCYLIDSRGNVVASSNRYGPDSLVGQNFAHHPYVQQSMSGETGHYLASGLITEGRGYYASFPVYSARGKILGVAAIKTNLDALEMNFIRHRGYAFLISPEGIIFLASHPEVALSSLWPLKKEVRGELLASRQFGKGPFTALLPHEPADGQETVFWNKTYLATRRIIDREGWSIALFSPNDSIVLSRLLAIGITMFICVLTISFFIATERSLKSAAQVAASENRFRIVFEAVPGAIFITDMETGRIIEANPFTVCWLGYGREELLSLNINDIRTMESEEAGECRYRKKDGAFADVEEIRNQIPYHGQEVVLIMIHDISDRKMAEALLKSLSMLDGLTGIANRRGFDEFLEREWRRAMREGTPVSLIMCDVDYFKSFNDIYGHLAGDDCLRRIAGVMAGALHRPGDMVARYGGEEFVVIMAGTGLNSAVKLAELLRAKVEALKIPHAVSSASSVVTLSLGVATLIPVQGGSSAELIAAADQALYEAKNAGRNCVRHDSFAINPQLFPQEVNF